MYFEKFFSKCIVFSLTETITLKAISLKQQRKMSLGDAIIAATAITEKVSLITANLKDFENVEELILIDPLSFDT
ncbi:MAG: PIN domain-containing protein [Aequorivita sp.]